MLSNTVVCKHKNGDLEHFNPKKDININAIYICSKNRSSNTLSSILKLHGNNSIAIKGLSMSL